MCLITVDGVPVIREGAGRLRWAHELEGAPPPLHAAQWQVGDLWPSEDERRWIRRRLDRGEPGVVVLDTESPRVELPVEHVPCVPRGVLAEHDPEAGMVTLHVPALDWLRADERARGLAFAGHVRSLLAGTPRSLLPPVLLEVPEPPPGEPLLFLHRTGCSPLSSAVLRDAVWTLVARFRGEEEPGLRRPA